MVGDSDVLAATVGWYCACSSLCSRSNCCCVPSPVMSIPVILDGGHSAILWLKSHAGEL